MLKLNPSLHFCSSQEFCKYDDAYLPVLVFLQNLLLNLQNILEMRNHRKILTFDETRVFVVVHTKRESNQACSLSVSLSMSKIMNFTHILLRLKCSPNMNVGNSKKRL